MVAIQVYVSKFVNIPFQPKKTKCWFWAGASTGSKLVQPSRTSLPFHRHESHCAAISLSHGKHLQFHHIAWNNCGDCFGTNIYLSVWQ